MGYVWRRYGSLPWGERGHALSSWLYRMHSNNRIRQDSWVLYCNCDSHVRGTAVSSTACDLGTIRLFFVCLVLTLRYGNTVDRMIVILKFISWPRRKYDEYSCLVFCGEPHSLLFEPISFLHFYPILVFFFHLEQHKTPNVFHNFQKSIWCPTKNNELYQ